MRFILVLAVFLMVTTSAVYADSKIKLTNGGNCSYYAQQKLESEYNIKIGFLGGDEITWKLINGMNFNQFTGKVTSHYPTQRKGACLITLSAMQRYISKDSTTGHMFWYDGYTIDGYKITLFGTESSTNIGDKKPESWTLNGCWYSRCKYTFDLGDKDISYITIGYKIPDRIKSIMSFVF